MKWHESESNAQDKRGIFFHNSTKRTYQSSLLKKKNRFTYSRIKKEMWKTGI